MNDQVIVFAGRVAGAAFVSFKWSIGDGEMVGVDVVFSVEFECGHGQFLSVHLYYDLIYDLFLYSRADNHPCY